MDASSLATELRPGTGSQRGPLGGVLARGASPGLSGVCQARATSFPVAREIRPSLVALVHAVIRAPGCRGPGSFRPVTPVRPSARQPVCLAPRGSASAGEREAGPCLGPRSALARTEPRGYTWLRGREGDRQPSLPVEGGLGLGHRECPRSELTS